MAEKKATRAAYGEALAALGEQYPELVVLDADLSGATMTKSFAAKFPERFFDCGIAECNMTGIAAGMAAAGLKPFSNSFAIFSAGRAYEQIRNSIAYPRLNVKVVGSHGGVSVGEDGAAHQCIEDFALMRAIPGMTVICPCDAHEMRLAVEALFQYALVETDVDFRPEDFTAIAVYSDLERTGWFDSSNELLNRFFEATVWSAKGNHLDIPTDCPTRERHGWTGDAQLFFTSAAYLFGFAPFARKYLRDVYDWQRKNGRLPHIAPEGGSDFYMWTMNGSVGWSDVGVLIPWRYAEIFGDESILRETYDGMAKYARFMERRVGRTTPIFSEKLRLSGQARRFVVNMGQSYGEWAEPVEIGGGFRWQDFVNPHPEVSTGYTAYVLRMMSEIAEKLGREDDAREFRRYAEGCTAAYRELVSGGPYSLDTDRQAQLVRPLYMGLLDEKQTEFARKRLIEALEHYGWRLGTGFLSTPLILYVLSDYDLEAAYRLLENEEIPGWLSMPKQGATTIWESWEGPNSQEGVASLNHYSKGAAVEWLFSTMCGIRVAGENRFTIAPRPGGSFTRAGAKYNSVYGLVESKWERRDGKTVYTVVVPVNCEAELVLPGGRRETLRAGEYVFEE